MMETMTELHDVKGKDMSVTASYTYLIVRAKVVINFLDILALGIILGDATMEFIAVAGVIEQDGIGFLSVTTGASCFLEIGFG